MKFWNTLMETTEIDPAIKDDVQKDYLHVKEKFKALNIPMVEDAELVFSNHIIALLKRIRERRFVEDMSDSFDEVKPEVFQMAEDLVEEEFRKEGLAVDKTEAFLIATHLTMALEK